MTITLYHPEQKEIWNNFIQQAVNGTFLFHRDFMEYHAHRFTDYSMMVYNQENVLTCCIPANRVGDLVYSHQGLTYGGFIMHENGMHLDQIIHTILDFLRYNQVTQFIINEQLPYYNPYYTQITDLYNKSGFAVSRELCNMQVSLLEPFKVSNKKTVGYRNGKFDNLKIVVNHDFKTFWEQLLVPQLAARHDAVPVHSLQEIELLASRFPDNIKQYLVYKDNQPLAGITFFMAGVIAKSQYAATAPAGMNVGALNFLYLECAQDLKDAGYEYLDYGPVNERDGSINRGVQRFKEELGCKQTATLQWTKVISHDV